MKKALRPSQRRELAVDAVANRNISVALLLRVATFQISATCYRYERKSVDENALFADWLADRPLEYAGNQENVDFLEEKHGFQCINFATVKTCSEFLFKKTGAG